MKQILVITNILQQRLLNIITSAMKQNEIATEALHIDNTSAMKQNEIATEAFHINNTSAMKQNEIATETLDMNNNVMVLCKLERKFYN